MSEELFCLICFTIRNEILSFFHFSVKTRKIHERKIKIFWHSPFKRQRFLQTTGKFLLSVIVMDFDEFCFEAHNKVYSQIQTLNALENVDCFFASIECKIENNTSRFIFGKYLVSNILKWINLFYTFKYYMKINVLEVHL